MADFQAPTRRRAFFCQLLASWSILLAVVFGLSSLSSFPSVPEFGVQYRFFDCHIPPTLAFVIHVLMAVACIALAVACLKRHSKRMTFLYAQVLIALVVVAVQMSIRYTTENQPPSPQNFSR